MPIPISQVSARSARSSGAIRAQATPDAFGAGIGRALQEFGGQVSQAAEVRAADNARRKREDVANLVAQSDFTPHELELRQNQAPDGAGYYDAVGQEYENYVFNKANSIEDDDVREEYKRTMLAQKPNVMSRSATYEYTLAATDSEAQANASLTVLNNKLMQDPTQYDTFVQQGKEVIAARPGLTPSAIQAMQTKWGQDAAYARFAGMLESAKTVEDIDNVAAELAGTAEGRDWAAEFSPTDYEKVVNQVGATRKAFVTLADTNARAALETLETRANDLVLIPQEELAAAQQLVAQSQNPMTLSRMARIMRDQDLKRQTQTNTAAETRAQANAMMGSPAAAYPGVPPQVSTAINTAVGEFDVSASYLGATAVREYGGEFKSGRIQTNPNFAPVPIHNGVDLRNVNPEVLDAATLAGELFGAPIQITSGGRSAQRQGELYAAAGGAPTVAKDSHHTSGTALDISTVGMSAADKGRLAAALADAGFTGFGEYGTHIHADMRPSVPASFGERNGVVWGGWTNLSPEIAQALTDRGFAAGLSSNAIVRNPRTQNVTATDFGVQSATSSATGVMQFTEQTFIGLMSDGVTPQRIGVDITGMSKQQILDLRKDPQIAVLAGAALAEKNGKALQSVLGRKVTDAELYMAHFLGVGGATTFLSAQKSQPEQSAAALLPQAADANKNIFYRNGKALTVQQVYDNIARGFVTEPSRVSYEDTATLKRIATAQEKAQTEDPMLNAMNTGTFNIPSLDMAGGMGARGAAARSVAEYYGIPENAMKPFTADEATQIQTQMANGSADDVLAIMSSVQQMGGEMARAAFAQIGQKDSVYGFAAGLAYDAGQITAASDIVRGRKRLEENEAVKTQIGASPEDINTAFINTTGAALFDIAPRERQAIQDAAFAHYVETFTARGGSGWDPNAYATSVQAVMGGAEGSPAIDTVNGQPTVLPPGISGPKLEEAFDRMGAEDWARMSEQGTPPLYMTGEPISPYDLGNEATLRAVGGGQYKVMLGDGTYAITGNVAQSNRLEAFIFIPDADEINKITERPMNSQPFVTDVPQPEQDDLFRMSPTQGLLTQFDENGRWIGPPQ